MVSGSKFLTDALERVVWALIAVVGGLAGAAAGDTRLPGGESGEVVTYAALITAVLVLVAQFRVHRDLEPEVEPMVDDQRFRWVDFPRTFEVINPDDSIAWSASFADGAWPGDEDDTEAVGD